MSRPRYFAVEDESEPGLGDFKIHLDDAALSKIQAVSNMEHFTTDLVYMRDKLVYGCRSNLFTEEADLLDYLAELKFIGPNAKASDSEEGKVFWLSDQCSNNNLNLIYRARRF